MNTHMMQEYRAFESTLDKIHFGSRVAFIAPMTGRFFKNTRLDGYISHRPDSRATDPLVPFTSQSLSDLEFQVGFYITKKDDELLTSSSYFFFSFDERIEKYIIQSDFYVTKEYVLDSLGKIQSVSAIKFSNFYLLGSTFLLKKWSQNFLYTDDEEYPEIQETLKKISPSYRFIEERTRKTASRLQIRRTNASTDFNLLQFPKEVGFGIGSRYFHFEPKPYYSNILQPLLLPKIYL